MKAERNRTIDISVEDGKEYLERCLSFEQLKKQANACFGKSNKEQPFPFSYVLDQTILGDTFEVLAHLPKESVDLLIVDPPYNLDKDFHGNKFKKTEEKNYEEYTECWVQAVKPLLKKDASVYVGSGKKAGVHRGTGRMAWKIFILPRIPGITHFMWKM